MKAADQVARAAVLTAIAVAVLAAALPVVFPYLIALTIVALVARALWLGRGASRW